MTGQPTSLSVVRPALAFAHGSGGRRSQWFPVADHLEARRSSDLARQPPRPSRMPQTKRDAADAHDPALAQRRLVIDCLPLRAGATMDLLRPRRALDPSRRGRATGLRRNHRRSSHRSRRSRGPHRPTSRDRYPCQRRPDQQRDRRPPIPLTPYCRLAPDLHIQNWPICVCTPRLPTNEVSAPSRRSARFKISRGPLISSLGVPFLRRCRPAGRCTCTMRFAA
jgi:hypothetical protein